MMALYSVYVTKLPLSITKRQLITLFSPTATVVDAYVCVNTSHTEYTYGFVRYLKLEDAKKAISEWDGVMYKDQRLMVEMSRHDSHTVPNSQDAGGARALGGRRLSGSGRVEDEGNWQELRRTWAMMKAGDETSVQWNTLVKELKQISFSLVPAFFVDDTKGSWSYSGDDPFQEEDSVTRMSPPLCRGSSQDSPQRSSERLPEARGGDADNQNSNVKELSRSCSADTLSSAGQSDKQNTTEFDKKDTETELANGGRMTERRNSCSKRDSDVCEQDHRGFNSVSTGLQGHQRSEPNEPHVEPTENRPPVKLVSIGRGKMLSLQLG